MFNDEVTAVGNAAKAKAELLKNKPLAYFFASAVPYWLLAREKGK